MLTFLTVIDDLALMNVTKNNVGIIKPIIVRKMSIGATNKDIIERIIDREKNPVPVTQAHLSFLATPAAKAKYPIPTPKKEMAK